MKGFEQRKQRETTRKFSKQLQDLKKQEKTQRIKKDTEEAGKSTFGRGDSSSGGAGKGRGGDREGAGGGQSDGKSARRLNMVSTYKRVSEKVLMMDWLTAASTMSLPSLHCFLFIISCSQNHNFCFVCFSCI